jgi:hypothetical protein
MRLGSKHIRHMISTGEDMDKMIVTVPPADLESHARALADSDLQARERAMLTR